MIDFNLDYDNVVKYDEVDLILQQVDILFDTSRGEVLGDVSYGTNYSDFYIAPTLLILFSFYFF